MFSQQIVNMLSWIIIIIIIFNLHTAAFEAYCAIWVRRSNFRHQVSPRISPRESTRRGKARNVKKFCLNADLHFTFRNLLHAANLRHGADGFTSPPKEASAGCEPAILDTKDQHVTSRPPKPLLSWILYIVSVNS
jgi:hypothetical protein